MTTNLIHSNAQRSYDRTSYILVVDDDSTPLEFFKIHLNKFFSKVIVVRNAKEALDTLKEKEIDLVITDVNMPRLDGTQLLKRVRKHNMAIPVLLISGAMFDQEKEDEIHRDSDGYLRKPFNIDQLHDFINMGMDLRAAMAKLAGLTPEKHKKSFRALFTGEIDIKKVFKDSTQHAEVQEIITVIHELLERTKSAPVRATG